LSLLVCFLVSGGSYKKKEAEKEKAEVPAKVAVLDPQKLPFETPHLCIYLRELEEEKEHKW
jgi:hypothetical protein